MKNRAVRLGLLVFVFGGLGVLAALACSLAGVCGDVNSSLSGTIVSEGITIAWGTNNENSQLGHYKILRYNCGNPMNCSVEVATVTPVGSCGTWQNYSYTDTPPTPVSQWKYTVEVWRSDNTRACAADTIPE